MRPLACSYESNKMMGVKMNDYRFACRQNDGSWLVHEFRSAGDDDAVTYGLQARTTNTCELHRTDGLLAIFDGLGNSRADIQPRAGANSAM